MDCFVLNDTFSTVDFIVADSLNCCRTSKLSGKLAIQVNLDLNFVSPFTEARF